MNSSSFDVGRSVISIAPFYTKDNCAKVQEEIGNEDLMGNRIIDATLIGAGTWQASVLDIPNAIWQDFIENPLPTAIGIMTLVLIIVRVARVIQKMRRDKRVKA